MYDIGRVIRAARHERKVSQDALCYGICSKGTLSKIESCQHSPGRKMLDALLQRLGRTCELYDISLSRLEYERYQLEVQITNRVARGACDFADLLEAYKAAGPGMDALEEQFYLAMSALAGSTFESEPERSWQLLVQAMRKSVPDFSPEREGLRPCLSSMELMVLNSIARLEYLHQNQRERAIRRLYFVREYFKTQSAEQEMARKLPCVLFSLGNWEEERGRYAEALALADEGLSITVRYEELSHLDMLLFLKGVALVRLGNRDEAEQLFLQAFAVMDVLDPTCVRKLEGVRTVNREFGYTFPE